MELALAEMNQNVKPTSLGRFSTESAAADHAKCTRHEKEKSKTGHWIKGECQWRQNKETGRMDGNCLVCNQNNVQDILAGIRCTANMASGTTMDQKSPYPSKRDGGKFQLNSWLNTPCTFRRGKDNLLHGKCLLCGETDVDALRLQLQCHDPEFDSSTTTTVAGTK